MNVAVAPFKYCSSVKKLLLHFVMYASHRYLGIHARTVAPFMKNNTPLPNIQFKPYKNNPAPMLGKKDRLGIEIVSYAISYACLEFLS